MLQDDTISTDCNKKESSKECQRGDEQGTRATHQRTVFLVFGFAHGV